MVELETKRRQRRWKLVLYAFVAAFFAYLVTFDLPLFDQYVRNSEVAFLFKICGWLAGFTFVLSFQASRAQKKGIPLYAEGSRMPVLWRRCSYWSFAAFWIGIAAAFCFPSYKVLGIGYLAVLILAVIWGGIKLAKRQRLEDDEEDECCQRNGRRLTIRELAEKDGKK